MQTRVLAILVVSTLAACGGDDDGGGDLRTIDTGNQLWGPRFSPDGSKLAVAFGPDDDLGTIDLATSTLTMVADNTTYLTGTAWSADGATVYYSGDGGVYQVAAAGGAPVLVTDPFAALSLDRSADGARLAWGVNGSDAEIYDVAGDTTTALDRPCQAIRFSPDGTEVACISGGALVVIAVDTRVATTVIADGLPFIAGVDWYNDGQALIVTTDDGIERITRSGERTLVLDTFATNELDLSPDEHSLVFVTNGSPDLSILSL